MEEKVFHSLVSIRLHFLQVQMTASRLLFCKKIFLSWSAFPPLRKMENFFPFLCFSLNAFLRVKSMSCTGVDDSFSDTERGSNRNIFLSVAPNKLFAVNRSFLLSCVSGKVYACFVLSSEFHSTAWSRPKRHKSDTNVIGTISSLKCSTGPLIERGIGCVRSTKQKIYLQSTRKQKPRRKLFAWNNFTLLSGGRSRQNFFQDILRHCYGEHRLMS